MIINLFSREIEIIKVDDNAERLNPELLGSAVYSNNTIYVDGDDKFHTILHEIVHFFLKYSGHNQQRKFTPEVMCDIFGYVIVQLMIENDGEILDAIKEFAEESEGLLLELIQEEA